MEKYEPLIMLSKWLPLSEAKKFAQFSARFQQYQLFELKTILVIESFVVLSL